MSQPQHTYTLRKEVGFGIELALSQLGEPHEIQIENFKSSFDIEVITTTDPLASLRARTLWKTLTVPTGVLTPVPVGVRKLAVQITAINSPNSPAPTVFHVPGFFRGAENARYYGVDQLDSPIVLPLFPLGALIHYDATDLSTLWQNTAGTTPVTADGDPLQRIDNKGSIGGFASRATANPEWDTDLNFAGGILHSGNNRLVQNFASQDFSGGYTLMSAHIPTLASLTQNWWAWDGFTFSVGQNVSDTMAGRVAGDDISGSPGGSMTIPAPTGTIQTALADGNKFVSYSNDGVGDHIDFSANSFPGNNTDFVIGANTDANLLPFTGVTLELAMWAPALTPLQRIGLEQYLTNRFAIAWV
jgi:hypothetical protein